MGEQRNERSATIYQFPAWPRARAEAQRRDYDSERRVAEVAVAVSSGWYHQAAIEDEHPKAS
jgi:hypothetical protein